MAFPSTYNFNYYRGDTFEMVVIPKSSSNTSFPLSGYTGAFTIANRRGSVGTTQYVCVAEINTTNNTVTCKISNGVGQTLSPGTYVYDVQITNSSTQKVYTILTGTVTVTDDITGALG